MSAVTGNEGHTKLPWVVEVEKLSGDHNFRAVFKVGVQSFTLAHVENDDEAEQHCHTIARMFRQAMVNAGCSTSEDWALNQLVQIGTLVGSHNAAETLGDVKALVIEVANGTGPIAEACKKRLALAEAIDKAAFLSGERSRIVQVEVQVNSEACGSIPLPENAGEAHAAYWARTYDAAVALIRGRAIEVYRYTPGKVINIIVEE